MLRKVTGWLLLIVSASLVIFLVGCTNPPPVTGGSSSSVGGSNSSTGNSSANTSGNSSANTSGNSSSLIGSSSSSQAPQNKALSNFAVITPSGAFGTAGPGMVDFWDWLDDPGTNLTISNVLVTNSPCPADCTAAWDLQEGPYGWADGGFSSDVMLDPEDLTIFTNGHLTFEVLFNYPTFNVYVMGGTGATIAVSNGNFGFAQSASVWSKVSIPATKITAQGQTLTAVTYPFAFGWANGTGSWFDVANIVYTTN